MRLIYFSPVPWQSFTQRPHEFVRWFHARYGEDVLWINPYPTRLPALGDLRRPHNVAAQADTPTWLKALQPRVLPIEPLPLGTRLNRDVFWRPILKGLREFADGGTFALVVGKPSALALLALKKITPSWSLYDAMDNFPAFYSGISARAMARLEKKLVNRVDSVWASASHTFERIGAMDTQPKLVRNACSATTLATLKLRPQEKFTLGYIGTVGDWFDWDCVCALADFDATIDIHIVGPIFKHPARTLPANITMMAPRPHAEAIKMLTGFSAGLIPFKDNALTAAVDPLKYYEYRAAGLPIISTSFGEMRYRSGEDGVYVIENNCDINQLIFECRRYRPALKFMQQFQKANDWAQRFDAAMSLEDAAGSNIQLK